MWDGLSAAASFFSGGTQTTTDAAIRRLVSPRSGAANGNQRGIVAGYNSPAGDTTDNIVDVASSVAGIAGAATATIFGKAGMDMLRQALPMVQYILIMAVVICLPFVIVISGYSFKVVGTATFGLFGLWFLTFWWELARWINNNMVQLLYSSDGSSINQWLSIGTSGYDQAVLQLVMWGTYLVLPTMWLGVLGWAGHSVGRAISSGMSQGSSKAQGAGDSGSQMIKGKLPK